MKPAPHMCQDEHPTIYHSDSGDDERCPVCRERDRAVYAEEQLAAVLAWADKFEADTKALPLGHEDRGKGASSYNWRMTFVRELRSSLRTEAEAA